MGIILSLWIILIFIGIRDRNDNQILFDLEQTTALRGISAIEIMIGHIGLAMGSMILYLNRKAGILFVGIFFLLSGYGVSYSVDHKANYLKHFLINRTVKLLLPAYVVKIIMLTAGYWLLGIGGGIEPVGFLVELNWYIWEQLLFYLIYWLAHKMAPSYVERYVGIFSVIFALLAYAGGMDNPWYGSSLCFALGIYYYRYEKKKSEKVDSEQIDCGGVKYYLFLAGALLVVGVSIGLFFILGNDNLLGNPIARNIASVFFGILVIMLLYKVRFGNRISHWLGKCSYEIFLIHPYMTSLLAGVSARSKTLFGVSVIVLSIIAAYMIHLLNEKILQLCLRPVHR